MQQSDQAQLSSQEHLFLSLAEQLARPLLHIAHVSELANSSEPDESLAYWQTVGAIANTSLQLVESYALSLRVHGHITLLDVQPVAVSSLLYDTAEALQPFAKQYGVEIELDTGPRSQPVLVDRSVLQSAMTSLGQVFVQAQAETDEPGVVRLAAHRSRYGIVAGLYGAAPEFGAASLRRAQTLHGTARQPLPSLVGGPATGVFVADSLLQTLATRLHVARYHKMVGLAATLQPSHQLQLV